MSAHEEVLRRAAALAAADQMREEVRERLREAPLFFAATGDGRVQSVFGSLHVEEGVALGFLLGALVSVWVWLAEISGESDIEIVARVLMAVAVRRDSEGGEAEDD